MKTRFECVSVQDLGGDERVQLQPMRNGNEDNKSFSSFTPSGHLELIVTNPDAYGYFKPGQEYTVNITRSLPTKPKVSEES